MLTLGGGAATLKTETQGIVSTIKRSGAVAVELWLKTNGLQQSGPARIVTISRNTSERNFTIGQEGQRLQVRMRASSTDKNGLPPLQTPPLLELGKWYHVIYSREAAGREAIYVDGKQVANGRREGNLDNWNDDFRLSIGDEVGGGRPWKGQLQLVRIFARGINASEAQGRFRAGADADFRSALPSQTVSLFERSIAPLLADKCLECHDAATRQGGLDLSQSKMAMAGGDSGPAILPRNSSESLLWQAVESGEMPADRPALSDDEIALIAKWIDEGADWTFNRIDPALYVHGGGDSGRWLARLTVPEYIATVRQAVGVDISRQARELLPKDLRADGFSNTTYNLSVDLQHIESYSTLASIITSKMDIGKFADRFSKTRRFTDKDMGALIEKMGEWLLRGPLEKREVIVYRGISTTVASSGGTYEQAVGLIVEAMLQSPRFIYRVEDQRGDGGVWPVSQYELASRLSYMIWGGPPDLELFAAAKGGRLYKGDALEKQIDRMLADKKAQARALQFVNEWLNLDSLANLQPERERFPEWEPQLAEDMRRETLAYFQHVALDEEEPLSRLLNYPAAFATERLAKHYRFPNAAAGKTLNSGSEQSSAPNLRRYDYADSQRGGLLTQGSVLTIGGDNASMVTRGLFVLHDLLRGVVKDPPPCVNTTPVPTRPGLTQRLIAQGRIESDACGGCHSRFEPLAFGLERFDGLGSYAEQDKHGNELRDDGEILVPGQSGPIRYGSARELMDTLAGQDRVKESLTWKVVQFAIGRPPTAENAREIQRIHDAAQAAGGSYRDTMRAIALSDLARLHTTEQ
jgi:mono/diheme cytochrome c family protein